MVGKILSGLVCLVAAVCTCGAAADARRERPGAEYGVRVWQIEQGLPGDTVKAVLQTRDGYVWAATNAGLARFDGVRFTVFDQRNTKELRSNECSALAEDGEGALWVGTVGGGLVRYSHGRFKTYGRAEGLDGETVSELLVDARGAVWAVAGNGLSVFGGARFETTPLPEGPVANFVFPDRAGRVWVRSGGWLSVIERGDVTTRAAREEIEGLRVEPGDALFRGRGGALWVARRGAAQTQLVRASDGARDEFAVELTAPESSFSRLYEDAAGGAWLVTRAGMLRVERGRVAARVAGAELGSDRVLSVFEDREGNVWVGTKGGLHKLTRRAFTAYTAADGLINDEVWAVYEDRRGDVWFGTSGGASRLSAGGEVTSFTLREGLAGAAVVSFAEDRAGRLLVGTTAGVSVYEDGRFTTALDTKDAPSNNVRAMLADSRGRLWLGTRGGGMMLYDHDQFRSYTTADGLGSNGVMFVHEDRAGRVWLGTTGGLSEFTGEGFKNYTTADGLSSNAVTTAHEDEDGALWLGTAGGGLVRYKDNRFKAITPAEGLGDDTVTRVLEDGRGDFWMGTLKGVFRVSRRELNDVADGKARAVNSVAYGKSDGMLSVDCNGGTQPAGWRTRDGRLWFPTVKGVAVADPSALRTNEAPPPVHVEEVIADKQLVAPGEGLTLAAGTRSVEIHYTGLSFTDPSKVRFRYRLEGFERDWVEAGGRRVAYYTNLPPGRYRFRVAAANNDGVWNEEGASLPFALAPYFYQTYWFYALALAALGAAAWGAYRLRVRQLRARYAAVVEERNRIARELHDTLAQGFAGVSMQLEAVTAKLPSSPAEAQEHLDRARVLVRSSMSEARRTVRDLRSELLEGKDLAGALAVVAEQLTAGTGVAAEVHVAGAPRALPSLVESNLLRVGQEAMTNAVRHARCTRLAVELKFTEQHVYLRVADDGRGFDADDAHTSEDGGGFGLRGMRERVRQLGGRLAVESRPGEGTDITAAVPVARA